MSEECRRRHSDIRRTGGIQIHIYEEGTQMQRERERDLAQVTIRDQTSFIHSFILIRTVQRNKSSQASQAKPTYPYQLLTQLFMNTSFQADKEYDIPYHKSITSDTIVNKRKKKLDSLLTRCERRYSTEKMQAFSIQPSTPLHFQSHHLQQCSRQYSSICMYCTIRQIQQIQLPYRNSPHSSNSFIYLSCFTCSTAVHAIQTHVPHSPLSIRCSNAISIRFPTVLYSIHPAESPHLPSHRKCLRCKPHLRPRFRFEQHRDGGGEVPYLIELIECVHCTLRT